jgi:NAD(P)-dependent dehydrogenase (short-subunit alcohol dehydrogenase family)
VDELRFDGRVAIVTGAGRGLGRAYARLLAARGASVVVNDLGGSMAGDGADAGPAASVVADIVAAGGAGVADTSDVSTPEGGQSLVDLARSTYGRVDVIVANAGIMRWASFPKADAATLAKHLDVHVGGSFHLARAAWPHLVEQGYGRIVLTTSTGVFGLPANLAYATAKGGVIGMARSLATAGAPSGIRVNGIAPVAATRMGGAPADGTEGPAEMAPELVAPMVAYLAHEDCPVTGEVLIAGAGRFSRLLLETTDGYVHAAGTPTPEDVAAHWAAITDDAVRHLPADLMAWSEEHLSHLPPGDPAS